MGAASYFHLRESLPVISVDNLECVMNGYILTLVNFYSVHCFFLVSSSSILSPVYCFEVYRDTNIDVRFSSFKVLQRQRDS